MREVSWNTPIEKAEFVFKREFMMMKHNYLCAACKKEVAVQNCNTGVLEPCWECQKEWKVIKVTKLTSLLEWIGVL